MPDNIGLAGGLAGCGTAFGVPFWSFIMQSAINPENQSADIESQEGERITRYFSYDVAKNVPHFFIIAFWVVFCFGCIVPFLLTEKSDYETPEENTRKTSGVIELDVLLEGQEEKENANKLITENFDEQELQKKYKEIITSWKFISILFCFAFSFAECLFYKNTTKVIGINNYDDAT